MASRYLSGTQESEAPVVVRLDSVSKRFAGVAAIRGLSLDIRRGEFLTLLGPSGCGKTTTLRLISGFEVPDSGKVLIGGISANRIPPYRRNVNTVFQSYALFPHLTVENNVGYGLAVKKMPKAEIRERVNAILQRVDLSDKATRYPRQLSGGQMQRVALARALVNEPDVLLLDEPLGALDAKLRRAMQVELRRIHRELGMTFVCVTHDQEEALAMSDRIAVLQDGVVAQIGSPQEIFQRPASRFVADFIGGCNFISGDVGGAGELVLPDGSRWQAGPGGAPRPVTIAIRPSRLMTSNRTSASVLELKATIDDVVYLGDICRLMLICTGNIKITAECDESRVVQDGLHAGQNLDLRIDPADIHVFEQSGKAAQ